MCDVVYGGREVIFSLSNSLSEFAKSDSLFLGELLCEEYHHDDIHGGDLRLLLRPIHLSQPWSD